MNETEIKDIPVEDEGAVTELEFFSFEDADEPVEEVTSSEDIELKKTE